MSGPKQTQEALRHIHAMTDLYFTRGINAKYENHINFFAQEEEYQPVLAECLPNIVKAFGKHGKGDRVRPALYEILKTKNLSWSLQLIKAFPEMIPLLFPHGRDENEFADKFIVTIKELWVIFKGCSWRYMAELIKVLPVLQPLFSQCAFNEYFLGELVTLIKIGNLQIKASASEAFCQLLRCNKCSKRRETYIESMMNLKLSPSCYERIGFAEFCKAAVSNFSQSFLKRNSVISSIATLGNDKVSSVRIRMIKLTTQIIHKLDKSLQEILETKIKDMLTSDPNKDVKNEARNACKTICVTLKNNEKYQEEVKRIDSELKKEENDIIENVIAVA